MAAMNVTKGADNRLPLTLVTGYLGAGKTTLVNHLLRHANGRRIMVLVNDFGEIAIDADLIESQEGDSLTLANGCICCSMGGDLFNALSDALDRRPRPDHLVIEASGVADPKRITEIARAEPELRLDGTVALVDAGGFDELLLDKHVGDSVERQLESSDLIVINKSDLQTSEALSRLERQIAGIAPGAGQVIAQFGRVPLEVLIGRVVAYETAPMPATCADHDHAHNHAHEHEDIYFRWSLNADLAFEREELSARLADLPPGLLRLKGFVRLKGDAGWMLLQIVGRRVDIEPLKQAPASAEKTTLVAIGVKGQLDPDALDRLFS